MNLGIILPCYNRPSELQRCFDSLRAAEFPKGTTLLVVDDSSTDDKTLSLIQSLEIPGVTILKEFNHQNKSVSFCLKYGFLRLFAIWCDVAMNLDSDAIVRADFIKVLLDLKKQFPKNIVTGFHSINKNKDGSDRHPILSMHDKYCMKSSVGGINMVGDEKLFKKYLLPTFDKVLADQGNWDAMACIASMKDGNPIVCSIPSVVQHIGFNSSMKHREEPDIACDFKSLVLPDVTLIGIDCDHPHLLLKAAERSMKDVEYGAVKLLSSQPIDSPYYVKIDPITHVSGYSEFVMRKLTDYIDTSHALIIQHDGFVVNAQGWKKEFLQYDYIGATWWYKDGLNVGNGGFSLRSKRLQELLKTDPHITQTHPEDDAICRTYRNYLETKHGVRFATEDLANRFSIEAHNSPDKRYGGQFGFHGWEVRFEGTGIDVPVVKRPGRRQVMAQESAMPVARGKNIIISQFQGLGDILFCMTLASDWIEEGYNVIWPVVPQYVSIAKHFPEIQFFEMSTIGIDHNKRVIRDSAGGKIYPLRWALEMMGNHKYKDVMRAKYDLLGKDWKRWRELTWVRDLRAEDDLFELLGLKVGEKYNLVNNNFRTDNSGKVVMDIKNGLRNVEMKPLPGYTMLDWGKVIEHATTIHTPGTAINYILELIDTDAEMHLYVRKPDEKGFSLYDYILTKEYVFHQ